MERREMRGLERVLNHIRIHSDITKCSSEAKLEKSSK